jgi:hypothetical protein
MALYRNIRKVHKKIAMKTFNSCIKDLKAKGLIATEDVNGRGRKIDHFLTNKGKQHVKLLPGEYENQSNDKLSERREKLRSVYLIILYTIQQDHTYTIKSEREFKDFLSKNKLSSKELIQLPQKKVNKMGEITTTTKFRHISGIHISKNVTSNGKNKGTVYKCSLPGLSVRDVVLSDNRPVFGYIKPTKSEVEDAFKLLHDDGLIEPIRITHNGDLRYKISDFLMEDFLEVCKKLYHLTYTAIEGIWNIRKPTDDEIKWMEQAIDTKGAEKMARKSNEARSNRLIKVKKNKKQFYTKATQKILEHRNMIRHDTLLLKKQYAEQIDKYQFLCDELLEIVYPKCLQRLSFNK